MPTRQGSIRLFQLAGVNLYLHWSWFVVAMIEISQRRGSYQSLTFNVLEYLALFVIVLLHEMGHALACRSVGGKADEIVLWPLGGVAYVAPPQRPGPILWSIAAGPLVNVVLFVAFIVVRLLASAGGWAEANPDLFQFLLAIQYINAGLLIFNVLPIYPLDGGQIVRALLWFMIGRAASLMAASIIGFAGVGLLLLLAWWQQSLWLGFVGLFIVANCWRGLQQARLLARVARLPRRTGFQCPSCHAAPPTGAWWTCGRCQAKFDTFETMAVCPNCATRYETTRCLDCGEAHPISAWVLPPPPLG